MKKCPFCNNPKKSTWYFDGKICLHYGDLSKDPPIGASLHIVIAKCPVSINPKQNSPEREDCLILFPKEHITQKELKKYKVEAEELLAGIARAVWHDKVTAVFGWTNRHYKHAHLQIYKIK